MSTHTTSRPYDLSLPSFRLLDSGDFDATDQAIVENVLRSEVARLLGVDRTDTFACVQKVRGGWRVNLTVGTLDLTVRDCPDSASAVDRVVQLLRGPASAPAVQPPAERPCDCWACGGEHRVVNSMGAARACDYCGCVP